MIIKAFKEQIKNNPFRIAVVSGESSFTYRFLNDLSNKISIEVILHSSHNNARAGEINTIALLVEHCPHAIMGILSLLKANMVYVPMDVTYPEKRLEKILEHCDASFILTNQNNHILAQRLAKKSQKKINILDIDHILLKSGKKISGDPDRQIYPDEPAYILYTSGTTGTPKGVLQNHRNSLFYVQQYIQQFSITPGDRLTFFSSISHDASIPDIFGGLLAGAVLCVYDIRNNPGIKELLNMVIREKITLWHSVPTLFRIFTQALKKEKLLKLPLIRYLVMGGEEVRNQDLELYREHFSKETKLANLYGQTESTLNSVWIPSLQKDFEKVQLGDPVENLELLLCDEEGGIIEDFGMGEIVVASDHVALGYYKDIEKSRKVFARDPELGKLYWTGDLGRKMSDGGIEFVGRKDSQVKIRGYRVELREIESTLLNTGLVKDVAVLSIEDEPGDHKLNAFIVDKELNKEKSGERSTESFMEELRTCLADQLPGYMIPARFIELEELPLTPNGKVDEKSLKSIKAVRELHTLYLPPETEEEKKVSHLWKEILGLERVGRNDNFFQIKGDSLKAMILCGRLQKEFEIDVPIKEIFIRPHLHELAEYIRQKKGDRHHFHYPDIQLQEEKEYYPASSAQKRMYLIQQSQPENRSYHLPLIVTLKGKPEREKLDAVFRRLIERHESFRTSFVYVRGELSQRITSMNQVNFQVGEYTKFKDFFGEFDLSVPPLISVGIISKEDTELILMVDLHHMISDGASLRIFIDEFITLYNEGERQLKKIKLRYKDYSSRQRSMKDSEMLLEQKKYWKEQMLPLPSRLELPVDYQRPMLPLFEGKTREFSLGEDHISGLREQADQQNVSLFMILLAVYNVFLSRITNQEDIVVGTPVFGRRHQDLEPVIGMFVNTLFLRNTPKRTTRFIDFLKELKKRTIELLDNQDYQFEELVDEIPEPGDPSRNPIFDVCFAFRADVRTDTNLDIPGLKMTPFRNFENRTSKFDLTLQVGEIEDELRFSLEYSTHLFKESTIERYIQYFKTLIQSLLQDPLQKISNLRILPMREEKLLLEKFNLPDKGNPGNKTLPQLFEEQVKRNPDRKAVSGISICFNKETRGHEIQETYGELKQSSLQVCGKLRKKGVQERDLVGVLMDPGIETIYWIFGVLMAGGWYLPMDPGFPKNRIHLMLKEASCSIVILNKRYRSMVEPWAEVLEAEGCHADTGTITPDEPMMETDSLAYLMYTSGTTGKPRAIAIPQKNVIPLVKETNYIEIFPEDKVLQLSNIAFDGSVFNIFGALLNGAHLRLIKREDAYDVEIISQIMRKEKITLFFLTTALFNLLVDMKLSHLRGIRKILFGGERASVEQVRKALEFLGRDRLIHVYGPTETTVFATFYPVNQIENRCWNIPIGKPVSGTTLYILDEELKPQPIGVQGVIYIGGERVAHGYANNPGLTVEQFVESPYHPGKRLYKTGDLGRWLPGGEIEFLGRKDLQVKIRGFRVELGEIERELLRYHSIKEAIVLYQKTNETKEDKHLCAYVSLNKQASQSIDSKEIRAYLFKKLPFFMIPDYFIFLEKIPLKKNGKVNVSALPKPFSQQTVKPVSEARTELEKKLVQAWSEVLGVDQNEIDLDQSFFELGGNSLKANKLVMGIYKTCEKKIPLSLIFNPGNIRDIAQYITKKSFKKSHEIKKTERKEYYPVSSAQKRMFILQHLDRESILYNSSLIAVLEGTLDVQRIESVFNKLIRRHEILRTSFFLEKEGGEPFQRIHENYQEITLQIQNGEPFPSEELTGKSAGEKVIQHFLKPFDLTRAPLLRVGLFKTGRMKYLLLLDMHHIITDGISMGILSSEFMDLYSGKQVKDVKLQYRDFSQWQCQQFEENDKNIKKQEDYWRRRFEDQPAPVNLPCDFSGHTLNGVEGGREDFELGIKETADLKKISAQNNSSLFMIYLALFTILMAKVANQEDITVGVPVSGRHHPGLDSIVGLLVNTLCLRNFPQGEKSFIQFLGEVREHTISAYDNQDYQYEKLVDELRINREPGHNPLFDVMFTFQDREMMPLETKAWVFSRVKGLHKGTSKFDLTLNVGETGDKTWFSFEYKTGLFEGETIKSFILCFKKILNQVILEPDVLVLDIDVLEEEEKKRILYGFNNTSQPYSKDPIYLDLFLQQVETNPSSIAVMGGSMKIDSPGNGNRSHITFQELNCCANQKTEELRKRGVGKHHVVALVSQRSLEGIQCVLGITKTGAASLAIDPGTPLSRIESQLKDSGASCVFTHGIKPEGFKNITFTIDLTKETRKLSSDSEKLFPNSRVNQPEDIVYLVYTSGSTGIPKGVLVEHRSLFNYLCWCRGQYLDNQRYRFPLYTAMAFDLTYTSVYLPLVTGNCIIIYDHELGIVSFKEMIQEGGVNIIKMTPSHLRLLLKEEFDMGQGLRRLILGGENLESELIIKAYEKFQGRVRIYNEYGPTEATIGCMVHEYDPGNNTEGSVPIGRPLNNTSVYLLDKHLNPVPGRTTGQLVVGGQGIARGYVNQVELTAERFKQSPFTPEERIYKTGDLARRLKRGDLEYLGREDGQFKIKGHRIEKGEIEEVLKKRPGIKDTIVLVKKGKKGENFLVAYMVAGDELLDWIQLRAWLTETLPLYMIPHHFVQVEKIPLNSNGKLDIHGLPEPWKENGEETTEPINREEERILDIWREVLGTEELGVTSNFFDLGGNSLDFIQVHHRLNKEFERKIPIVSLFQYPTIRSFSGFLIHSGKTILKNRLDTRKKGSKRLESIRKRKIKG